MRRIMCLVVLVLMAVTVLPVSADFYVIGGGGGVGTKITSLPYTIINPGFYFLTGNLSVNGGDAILVNADDVTIDLMGFSLTNTGDIGLTTGILMSGRTNVEIRNGIVRGFHRGIKDESSSSNNHRAINVRARNNNVGILFWGSNQLIKNCNVSNNQQGISMTSGLIINNIAANSAIVLTGPGSLLGNTAYNDVGHKNFILGGGIATSILVDGNSAFGAESNYDQMPGTTGVVITANNSGTPNPE